MFAQGFEYVKLYVNISYEFFINSFSPQVNNLHHVCLMQARTGFREGSEAGCWDGAARCHLPG